MCHGVESAADLQQLLERATVVAVGPGLGRSDWARELLGAVLESTLPLVVDADALNLLAGRGRRCDDWVLTPHPGEAGRLLGVATAEIQQDRFAAARRLMQTYGGTVVLKGAGTLVQGDSTRPPAVCSDGNPGMASGGMGDLLSGLIAGCVAAGSEGGIDVEEAACMAVCLHAAAGDAAARTGGERGMLATDLLPFFRTLLNPEVAAC
jgi:NAD(P)H-hydrate epimerase